MKKGRKWKKTKEKKEVLKRNISQKAKTYYSRKLLQFLLTTPLLDFICAHVGITEIIDLLLFPLPYAHIRYVTVPVLFPMPMHIHCSSLYLMRIYAMLLYLSSSLCTYAPLAYTLCAYKLCYCSAWLFFCCLLNNIVLVFICVRERKSGTESKKLDYNRKKR